MIRIPAFLHPSRELIDLYRIHAGVYRGKKWSRIARKIDVVVEPLPMVFLLASALIKLGISPSAQLRGVLSHARFSNVLTMSTFERLARALSNEKIPLLAQKGLIFKLTSPNVIRPINDADIAVFKSDYARSIDVAKSVGFELKHQMMGSADMQYRDMGRVDIHVHLFKGINPITTDLVMSNATTHRYQDMDILIPCAADNLAIIMCEFYGNFIYECGDPTRKINRQFKQHPMWVLDAYNLIKNNPDLDWGRVMNIAKLSGYEYQIRILAKLLNKIFPGLISKNTMRLMRKMCPDYTVWPRVHRDKKMVNIHRLNSEYYDRYGLFGKLYR